MTDPPNGPSSTRRERLRTLRSLRLRGLVPLIAMGACTGCGGWSGAPNRNFATGPINETMLVQLPGTRLTAFARDLRSEVRAHPTSGHIAVNSGNGQSPTRETKSAAFDSALDDARRKAREIATHEHIVLGPVCDVSEVSNGSAVVGALKGMTNMVRLDANGPAAVVVDYALGGSCGANARGGITVAGYGSAPAPALPDPSEFQTVQLRLQAGGTTDAETERSLAALELAVHTVVRRYGRGARYLGVESVNQY